MNRVLVGMSLGALFLLCASCEKEKSAEQAAPSATPAVSAPQPTAAAVPAQPIPVAADFEEEAEKSITLANYKAELDSLEAEIK
jgi:hypothetical protein